MTAKSQVKIGRRRFVQAAAAAVSVGPLIVPRHVLGGVGFVAPSDTFGGALIGCGGQGNGTYGGLGLNARRLAECDVRFLDRADNRSIYTDFRRVMDRKDIDAGRDRHAPALALRSSPSPRCSRARMSCARSRSRIPSPKAGRSSTRRNGMAAFVRSAPTAGWAMAAISRTRS